MMTRRMLLGSIVSAAAAAGGTSWLLAGVARQPFHLPLEPETALWRRLLQIRQLEPWQAPQFAPDIDRLDGETVTLRGFMLTLREAPRHQHFTLTANPV